jgi:hypothetical protein
MQQKRNKMLNRKPLSSQSAKNACRVQKRRVKMHRVIARVKQHFLNFLPAKTFQIIPSKSF